MQKKRKDFTEKNESLQQHTIKSKDDDVDLDESDISEGIELRYIDCADV